MCKFSFAFLLLFFFFLVGCIPANSTGESLVEITRPPATAVAPTALPRPTQVLTPTAEQNSTNPHGVSFQIDPILASGVQPQLVDAFTTDSGMDYLLLPQHLTFTFSDNYTNGDPLLQRQQLNLETMPQIVVYPAAAYAAMHPLAQTQIELLQALLAKRPSTPGGTLPYLPLVNAAQVLHAQVAYLTFANGAGVRYVTTFSQESAPIVTQQLIYTFQGLTDDGKYYVAAFFPLKTAVLPETIQVDDWDTFFRNYSTYLAETKTTLNALAPSDFTPDLTLLDTVVTSLQVAPDVELQGAATTATRYENVQIRPIGVYQAYADGLYQLYRVEMDGTSRLVAERPYSMSPAPDADHAVYVDENDKLWLIDLADDSEKQLTEDNELVWLHLWGDADTLLLGVELTDAVSEGPSTGHPALMNIDSGELHVIDQEYLAHGRPAMSPDGQSIAYDGTIYRPESGAQPLDQTLFVGLEGEEPCALYNPAWSPDGRQLAWLCAGDRGSRLIVFDMIQQTALTLYSWQPAQFGALPPSPVWSSDGKWVAVEIWANNRDENGLWVFPADGTMARLHLPTGHEPLWLNATQLVYADRDMDMNGNIKLYDLDFGEVGVLELPATGQMLLPSY